MTLTTPASIPGPDGASGYARGGFTGPKQYFISEEFIRGVETALMLENATIDGKLVNQGRESFEGIIATEILRQREAAGR